MKQATRNLFRLAGTAAMLLIAGAAAADDSEIFTGMSNSVSIVRPNILFIFDTSGSMSTDVVTQVPFDPAATYAGSCSASRIYFRSGSNTSNPPNCSDNNSVPAVAFKCDAAVQEIATFGNSVQRAAQWRGSGPRWRNVNGNTGNSVWVECEADAGVHGDGVNLAKLWPADAAIGPWTAISAQSINWSNTA